MVDKGTLALTGGLSVIAGTFDLAGGTLQASSIGAENPGSFFGYGTVQGSVDVTGAVEATTATPLDFSSAVTGTGAFKIDAGAALEFDSSVGVDATVSFAGSTGTLIIGQPSSFAAEIFGISGNGQVLELIGLDASTTATTDPGSYNSDTNTTTLTVLDQGQTLEFTLAGDLSGSSWTVTENNTNTGVDIVDPPGTSGGLPSPDKAGRAIHSSHPSAVNAENAGFTTDGLVANNGSATTGWKFWMVDDQIKFASGLGEWPSEGQDSLPPGSSSVSTGGTDNLVFHDGTGVETHQLSATHDNLEPDPPGDAQTMQQLESLITTNTHVDAMTGLQGDNVTIDAQGGIGSNTFYFSQQGSGTLVYNPPTTDGHSWSSGWQSAYSNRQSDAQHVGWSHSPSVSIGGPSSDNFLFHPSLGSDPSKSNPQANANAIGDTASVSLGGLGNDNIMFHTDLAADMSNFEPQHDSHNDPSNLSNHYLALQSAVHLH